MKINEIPVILHSMDSYSRFWNPWYQLFNLHCKNHGPIIFLSEEKEPDFIDDVTHIKTGSGEWGERLLTALKQIDSELVFYMQEDFWCVNDYELTDQLLEMFEKYGMDQLHIKENTHLISTKKIEDNLYRFEQNSEYTQNHQFGLWRKDKLIENVLPHENPWQNEVDGSKRLNEKPHNVYLLDFHWYVSVCRRGQLMERGEKIIEKYGISF
jgi:hypothetical protein